MDHPKDYSWFLLGLPQDGPPIFQMGFKPLIKAGSYPQLHLYHLSLAIYTTDHDSGPILRGLPQKDPGHPERSICSAFILRSCGSWIPATRKTATYPMPLKGGELGLTMTIERTQTKKNETANLFGGGGGCCEATDSTSVNN